MAFYLTCILLVGACCAYSAGGDLTYNFPVRAGGVDYSQFNPYNDRLRADTIKSLTFQTMGNNDAHILLQNNSIDFNNKVVEIVIGGWSNSRSVIRDRQQGPALSSYSGSLLSGSSFQWFWISWNGGCVKVGKGSAVGDSKIMEWCRLSFPINGIRFSYGYGSGGTFIIPLRHAAVRFANYYANHMVLQKAPAQAHIWGTGGAVGQSVTVVMDGKTVATLAANDAGVWEVLLPATVAGGPHNISVTSNGTTVSLRDVLFGDVWICSGQSNMEYSMNGIQNYSALVTTAMQRNNLRIFRLDHNAVNRPTKEPAIVFTWQAPGQDWQTDYFSAVCLIFAIELSQNLTQPFGMVETNWGGTPVEAWSSPEALAACPQQKKKRAMDPNLPSVLYNGMIAPILPMTIFGAIWYQGESNAGRPHLYACQFKAMISDWRTKFHQASKNQTSNMFPFGFVQLAPFRNTTIKAGFSDIRWAQTAEYGYVPNPTLTNVFMAVAMDLPDYDSPQGSIHPRYKEDIAARLALGARGVAYGQKNIDYQGPFPTRFSLTGQRMTIEYDNGNSDIAIRTTNGFEICCGPTESQVCQATGWIAAPISGHGPTSVTLDNSGCHGNSHIVAGVRYAWEESPCDFKKCAVYGLGTNLPAPPFVKNAPFN